MTSERSVVSATHGVAAADCDWSELTVLRADVAARQNFLPSFIFQLFRRHLNAPRDVRVTDLALSETQQGSQQTAL